MKFIDCLSNPYALRGGMNNPFGEKVFLINSDLQNSRKVFPG